MHLLYLAQRVPYPPDRGDKIKTYHEVQYLARHHDVTIACLADGPEDLENVRHLASQVAAIDAVMLRPTPARIRAATALATGTPLTVAYFNERDLHQCIQARVAATPYDVVLVNSSGMAQFVEQLPTVPRIMQFVDIDSVKWEQFGERAGVMKRWIYRLEADRLKRYERYIASTFERSLVCTPREHADLQRRIPGVEADWVGNGVDLDYFTPMEREKTRHSLIFTGMMDYFQNVDGVVWFCQEILPLIRQRVPDTTFTICGAKPDVKVKELGQLPGVSVTGWVEDVRPYLASASVGVIPLRMGRGIQNKLLEAMAMGLPCVATTSAYTGVEATEPTDLLVADEPQSFADCVVRLLQDDSLRARTGYFARLVMEKNYSWDLHLARLDEILNSVITAWATSSRGVGNA